jgi:hypothetical protein
MPPYFYSSSLATPYSNSRAEHYCRYSGGEGRGEGEVAPGGGVTIFAGFNPLTPNPSPPEYRGRGA